MEDFFKYKRTFHIDTDIYQYEGIYILTKRKTVR